MNDYAMPTNDMPISGRDRMLRVALPSKGTLAEPASHMLAEAGYQQRHDAKDLTVIDVAHEVEFFFLRPRDISVYVGSGELDLGITGRDLVLDSEAPVTERLALGFGGSSFRYAAPVGRDWKVGDLEGLRVATAYPRLVKADLARHGVHVTLIRLDGAVEISVQLGGGCDRRRGWVRAHPTPAWPGGLRRPDLFLGGGPRGADRRGALAGAGAARRAPAGRGIRSAVPDTRLRLPAHPAGCGDRHHSRPGVADTGPAGRSRLGRGTRDGSPQRLQPDHG